MRPTALILGAAAWAFAPAAMACTLCDSDTAVQVRALVFAPGVWRDLAGLAAPIPALILAILAVHHLSR